MVAIGAAAAVVVMVGVVMMVGDGAGAAVDDGKDHGDLARTIRGSDNDPSDVSSLPPPEVRRRLKALLDALDTDDDGYAEEEEVTEWLLQAGRALRDAETAEDFAEADADGDGEVTWEEHVRQAGELEGTEEDKARFDEADEDDDGKLTKEEHLAFSQPDEDKEMLLFMVKQTMERKDKNKDGKLSLEEFRHNVDKDEDADAEEFDEEDEDNDDVLNEDEVRSWLEHDYSSEASEVLADLLKGADDDGDGRLSYDEVLEEPELMKRSLLLEAAVQLQKRGLLGDGADGRDEL